jgi:hypothetical protein
VFEMLGVICVKIALGVSANLYIASVEVKTEKLQTVFEGFDNNL